MKKALKLEKYTVKIAPPENRLQAQCVNVYADGKFNMNEKLKKVLGQKSFLLRFTEDAKHFALIPEDEKDGVIRFPKSGSRKLPDVVEALRGKSVSFPARFDVWFNEEEQFWQGDLQENPTQKQLKRRQ